jgi:ribosome-associated heat shock protein Hsp15
MTDTPIEKMRVDKWLWHARFFKTRGVATKMVSGGHLRVNGNHVTKPAFNVGAGDTLTFPQAKQTRVVQIIATSTRRGPAPEAQALYDDQTPVQDYVPPSPKFEGKGRPTKKDRRNTRPIWSDPID